MILILIMCMSCEKEDQIINENGITVETTDYKGMTIVEQVGMKNVFTSTRINMPSEGIFYSTNYFDRSFVMNDRIYFAIEHYDPEIKKGYAFVYFYSYDFNGKNEELILLNPVNENAEIRFAWYDSNYNVILIEELDYTYTFSKFNELGEMIFSMVLNDIIENNTVLSMVIGDEEDNIYIATADNKVVVFSKYGEILWQTSPNDTILHLSSAHGKTPILKMKGSGNISKYQYIDIKTKTIKDIEMPHGRDFYMYSYLIYGDGYDYYHIIKDGVYGYDIATNTLTKVLDWNNSDLIFSQLRMITVISPDKIFIGEHDLSDYKYKIYMLDHISNDELPDKTYISIGYINSLDDTYLNQAVSDFNKYSDEYRITLTNYYPKDGNTDLTYRLNTEIAAGNTPDILYINSNIPMLKYIKNGLFDDLYKYLADEPDLYDNLLPFVTESVEVNDKLPQMITQFKIKTLMGKSKNFANKKSWTISDTLEMYKSLSYDVIISYELTQTLLNNYVLDNILTECINYNNGTCDFNKQGFKDYIELYSLLPEYFDYVNISDYSQFIKDNYAKCRNDEMLLGTVSSIGNIIKFVETFV